MSAAGAGFVAWALGAVTSAWLTGNSKHEGREKRYDDVKSAYVYFYSTMRQIVEKAELDAYHEGGTYADRDPHLDPIALVLAGTDAETALAHLRLSADQPLCSAGREWLDALLRPLLGRRQEEVLGRHLTTSPLGNNWRPRATPSAPWARHRPSKRSSASCDRLTTQPG